MLVKLNNIRFHEDVKSFLSCFVHTVGQTVILIGVLPEECEPTYKQMKLELLSKKFNLILCF